jgi:hypothetical protein
VGSERVDLGAIGVGGYVDFHLNAAGLAAVVRDGWTILALREGHDVEDVAISPGKNSLDDIHTRCGGSASGTTTESARATVPPSLKIAPIRRSIRSCGPSEQTSIQRHCTTGRCTRRRSLHWPESGRHPKLEP